MFFFRSKIGKGWCDIDPLTNSFFLLGVLTSVQTLVKIDQEMRPWECSQTDTLTDANRFYNLSHAICYRYGTDKNSVIREPHVFIGLCWSSFLYSPQQLAYTVNTRIVGYPHLLYTACLITVQLSLVLSVPISTDGGQVELIWMAG